MASKFACADVIIQAPHRFAAGGLNDGQDSSGEVAMPKSIFGTTSNAMTTFPFVETESASHPISAPLNSTQLDFELAGRSFQIDCLDDWSASAVSQLLNSWLVTEASSTAVPDYIIKVRSVATPPPIPRGLEHFEIADGGACHSDGETTYVILDGSLITLDSTRSEVNVWIKSHYDLSSRMLDQILSQAMGFAWRRCQLFLLHSAGVVMPGHDRTFLIAGESGSGKSTLTFQLATAGWRFLSDDSILLIMRPQGIETYGLRKFLALTSDTMASAGLETGRPLAARKTRISAEHLFPQRQVEFALAGAIIFPTITHVSESRLAPLKASETMQRLMRISPWACYDKPTAAANLKVFAALARSAPAYELSAGKDLLGNPELTAQIVSRANIK